MRFGDQRSGTDGSSSLRRRLATWSRSDRVLWSDPAPEAFGQEPDGAEPAPAGGQDLEESVLGAGQGHRLPHRVTRPVSRSIQTGPTSMARGRSRSWDQPCRSAPDPGQQLSHGERLGDVVIGAEVERRGLVALVVDGGEDHDRRRRPGPEARHLGSRRRRAGPGRARCGQAAGSRSPSERHCPEAAVSGSTQARARRLAATTRRIEGSSSTTRTKCTHHRLPSPARHA